MIAPGLSMAALEALPLRAIVAFATRCARRVEALAQLPDGHPGSGTRRETIDAALRFAEDVSRGAERPPSDSIIQAVQVCQSITAAARDNASAISAAVKAASSAASVRQTIEYQRQDGVRHHPAARRAARMSRELASAIIADLVVVDAFRAVVDAQNAASAHDECFERKALDDYARLHDLDLGLYPEPGEPVDPSPEGPLGPI